MNFPNHVHGRDRITLGREWGNRSAISHAIIREHKGADADTRRHRSREDARGQIIREGTTYRATGITHWQIRRSIKGACDQFDFIANGRVKLTAGPRRFPAHFRPQRRIADAHEPIETSA